MAEKLKRNKRKLDKTLASHEGTWDRCMFFLKKKKRYCNMPRASESTFCCHHRPTEEQGSDKRVPCPLDQGHTVFERDLKKHLTVCNAKKKQDRLKDLPFFVKDINSGKHSAPLQPLKGVLLDQLISIDVAALVSRIKKAHEKHVGNVLVEIKTHAKCRELLQEKIDANAQRSAVRHVAQQASIIGHMAALDLLESDQVYMEFGAGRAMLSYALSHVVPNTSFVLLDRSGSRRKADSFIHGDATRALIDLRDFHMGKMKEIEKKSIVVFSKHLCGVATDLSLRALAQTLPPVDHDTISPFCRGIAIALCCHHRMRWEDYINPSFFCEILKFTAFEFQLIVGMSTWATCNLTQGREGDAVVHQIGLSKEQRVILGRKCKQLLDAGRVAYLKQKGFQCKTVEYCSLEDSLENNLLLAWRNMKKGRVGIAEFSNVIEETNETLEDDLDTITTPVVIKSALAPRKTLFKRDPAIKYEIEDPGRITVVQNKPTLDCSADIGGKVFSFQDDQYDEVLKSISTPVEAQEFLEVETCEMPSTLPAKETRVYEIPQYDMAPQVVVHSSSEMRQDITGTARSNPVIKVVEPSPVALPPPSSQMQLMVTAVDARNLAQMQRFGTQTPFLELKIGQDGASVRTFGHKKGGAMAEWNQNFILAVNSLDDVVIFTAKNANGVIGQAGLKCGEISAGHADDYFKLFNPKTGQEAGEVRLQLRLVDKSSDPAPVCPLPSKPFVPEESELQIEIDPYIRGGGLLTKIPYHTVKAPKRQWFVVEEGGKRAGMKADGIVLHWSDPHDERSISGYICLKHVSDISTGHKTKPFWKQLSSRGNKQVPHEDVCFSLITKSRSLDIAASSKDEAERWIQCLSSIVFGPKTDMALNSARVMDEYRTAALTARTMDDEATLTRKQTQWLQAIFDLARRNQIAQLSKSLAEGCPIDLMEPGSGDTILMIAGRQGHDKLVEMCLTWRAKNDPHPQFGETALQAAVIAQQVNCVRLLLDTAAKSDMDSEIVNHADPRSDAPIHVATSKGDMKCLELLLHHGADISLVDAQGRTALHCAAANDQYACAAYLLDFGADSLLDAGDHHGNTALHCAAMIGSRNIVTLLLQSAASVQAINADNLTAYDMARQNGHTEAMTMIVQYSPDLKESSTVFSRCLKPGEGGKPSPRTCVVARLDMKSIQASRNSNLHERPRTDSVRKSRSKSKRTSKRESRGIHRTSSTPVMTAEPPVSARVRIRGAMAQQSALYLDATNDTPTDDWQLYGQQSSLISPRYYDDTGHSDYHTSYQYEEHGGQYAWNAASNTYDHSYPAGQEAWSRESTTSFAHSNAEWNVYYTETGDVYYTNSATGASQWEDPRSSNQTSATDSRAPAAPREPEGALPMSPGNMIRAQLGSHRRLKKSEDEDKESTTKAAYHKFAPPSIAVSEGKKEEEEEEEEQAGSFQKSRRSSPRSKSQTIQLLDVKRANNVALGLKKFKDIIKTEDIVEGLVNIDENILSVELLRSLKPVLPTPAEIDLVRQYDGDLRRLGKAEQFFKTLEGVNRIPERVDSILFKVQFEARVNDLSYKSEFLARICNSILSNCALHSLFQQLIEGSDEKLRVGLDLLHRATSKNDPLKEILTEILKKERKIDIGMDPNELKRAYNIAVQSLDVQIDDLASEVREFESQIDQHALERLAKSSSNEEMRSESIETLREFIRFCDDQLKIVQGHAAELSLASRQVIEHFGEKSLSRTLQSLYKFIQSCYNSN